jgi:AcrR family transcriptional regulator
MRTDDRRQARELTQESTLDAAERLAGFEGVAGLSLKRLAEEAGLSTMVIYSHFGDRYGLEEALLRRAFRSLTDAVVEVEADVLTAEACAQAIRLWSRAHPARFSMVFSGSQSLDPGLQELGRQHLADLAVLVEQRMGWSAPGGGLTLLAGLFGYLTLEFRGHFEGHGGINFDRLSEALVVLASAQYAS